MKKRDTVPATIRMKITLWASSIADKLKLTSIEDCKALIKKEFGCIVAPNFVRDLYHAIGVRVPRERPSIPESASGTGLNANKLELRLRVLARIVRTGFKDAGLPVPPTLDVLCVGGIVANPDADSSLEKNNGNQERTNG